MNNKSIEYLQSLEFLTGDWLSEASAGDGIIYRKISYQWEYDKHYLKAKSERRSGDIVIKMTIVYLWDALSQGIKSWVRASDGEWSQADVYILGQGVVQLHSQGVNANGQITSLNSTLEQLDENTRTESWSDIYINEGLIPSPEPIVWLRD